MSIRRCGAIRCSEVCLLNAYCICVLELMHARIDPYTSKQTNAYMHTHAPLELTECGCKCAKWFPRFLFTSHSHGRKKTVCAFNITHTHTRPCNFISLFAISVQFCSTVSFFPSLCNCNIECTWTFWCAFKDIARRVREWTQLRARKCDSQQWHKQHKSLPTTVFAVVFVVMLQLYDWLGCTIKIL